MMEHLSPGTVYKLFRGHLSEEEREELLRHLLECPLCQGLNPARIERQASTPASDNALDGAVDRAVRAALATEKTIVSRKSPGDPSPDHPRKQSVDPDLAQIALLIERSKAIRFSDPPRMVAAAEMALAAVERLSLDRFSREILLDQKSWVLAELANAYRVADDMPRAWATMLRSIRWLRDGTGDLLVRARVIDLLASLLAAQRRLPEAIRLTQYLAGLYKHLGDEHLEGRALISSGVFLNFDDRPEEGLPLLVTGLKRIDKAREPGLFEHALVTIIDALTEAGYFAQARRTAWRCQVADVLPKDTLTRLRLLWIEGKIQMGLGHSEQAERALIEARDGFHRAKLPYNQALVGLDLALLWLRQERRQLVLPLLEEMLGCFRQLRIARDAFVVLLVLRDALNLPDESTERLCRRIELAGALLPRAPASMRG